MHISYCTGEAGKEAAAVPLHRAHKIYLWEDHCRKIRPRNYLLEAGGDNLNGKQQRGDIDVGAGRASCLTPPCELYLEY
jgi:hypothetical protein